ncbi:isochorismatase family cysteine hydrolase [Oceanirhabdus seepicola]|uniref:Cysteine hydrolase n=1 Tax=Oceanirhabdus seepicola TaxID=2828781 RepID=A0A9J6P8P5_9CLOT|nr:isochorismatase family cysteine hydrolase [Oceanirhabdus seepicola]MCM1992564.1 cysteine hydrolase [Oceanirhabdus seepicola]
MKAAIVIIDIQRYFFRTEERRLALEKVINGSNELISYADEMGIPVYHVVTEHKADKSTWNLVMQKHNFAALIEGSTEAEMFPQVIVKKHHRKIMKTRQSTFIRTDFEERLKSEGIDTLIIGGVFTHGCVGRTAVDAYERDFNVIVAKDASFSNLKDQEKVMFDVITIEQEQLALDNKEIKDLLFNTQEAKKL